MTTETYELVVDGRTDAITVTTVDNEVSVRFFTDGTETGGPDHYDTDDSADNQRLREYLNGYRHDGYILTSITDEDE